VRRKHREVGIKVIRSVVRSLPKATVGSGRQDRKGIGTSLGYMPGLVVLCPSLRSHQQAIENRWPATAILIYRSADPKFYA
jgi:hypothetical protein